MLATYAEWTTSLALIPGSGGQFEVVLNGDLIFSKKQQGRYPEIKELKDAITRVLK